MAVRPSAGSISLLSTAFCVLAVGCRKGPDSPDDPQALPRGPLTIIAGDDEEMDIAGFDTVFINTDAYGSTAMFPVDLDTDGSPDFRFVITTWHSMAQGFGSSIAIHRLNSELRWDGYFVTDTVLDRVDSILEYNTLWTPPYQLSVIHMTGCGLQGNVSINAINTGVFRPELYGDGETMDTMSYVDVDDVFMTRSPLSYSSPQGWQPLNDSTAVLPSWQNPYNCFVIPLDTPYYLGFAIGSDGALRKGWLGFALQSHRSIALTVAAMEPE